MITKEFKEILKYIILYGETHPAYYYSAKISIVLPNQICVWVLKCGNVVAKSPVNLSSLVQGNGTLTFTLIANFNSCFTGTEVRLVALFNNAVLYVISVYNGNVSSSGESPLYVEWDITVGVNNVFQLPSFVTNATPLPCTIQGYCGCVVFYFIALLVIPNPYFTVPNIAPSSNLAHTLSLTPQGSLCGISVIAFVSGAGVAKDYGDVDNLIGTILASMSYDHPPYYLVVYYRIGNQVIPLMITEIGNVQQGKAYTFKICVNVD